MSNRLMILGTNECLLKRACELGFEVHAFGLNPPKDMKYDGKDIFFHKQNILDYDILWQKCQELNPKGVVSVCSELAMHPMHFLLRKMGINCNSEFTEQVTTDKYLMRKVMRDSGIDSPRFTLITEAMTAKDVEMELMDWTYPLIVKPVDLSASRGIMKVESKAELAFAINYALKWSHKRKCVVEEYIEGPEYSGESIAFQGNYHLLAITEKETTGPPHFVEKAHRQPAQLSAKVVEQIEKTLFEAFKALRIEYGAIHPEFRITDDGRIIFMEIATRMGGDHIGTELTPISSGYDFLGMVIDISCGKKPNIKRMHEPKSAEVHYIISEKDLSELNKKKNDPFSNLVFESKISKLPKEVNKSSDRAGYYIVTNK